MGKNPASVGNFKRNDKVTVFDRVRLHPKLSDTTYLIPGKRYIIKRIYYPDNFSDVCLARIEGPTEREKVGEHLVLELHKLYKYTKLGELLYG